MTCKNQRNGANYFAYKTNKILKLDEEQYLIGSISFLNVYDGISS